MKRHYVHFATDNKAALPPLKTWRTVYADNYTGAVISALRKQMPWEGTLWAHVHAHKDTRYKNGMPVFCQTFELKI